MHIFVLVNLFIIYLTTNAAATLPLEFYSSIQGVESILLQVGSALGVLIITFEAIKWIAAQNPAERESAKKGVLYVMIGLIILRSSESLITFLLVSI